MSTKNELQEKDALDFASLLESEDHGDESAGDGLPALNGLDVESDADTVARLKEYATRLIGETYTFKHGDIIRWKRGMKNKRHPANDTPIVVIEVLEAPVYDKESDAGSPYFREPLTLKAGCLDGDGDFLIFHYDSRRFEPYTL